MLKGIKRVKDYQDNSTLQWNWAMESLESYPFNRHDKVLDLGCGDGRITDWIAAKAGFTIGMDISKEMIEHASTAFNRDNLLFLLADGTTIPFFHQFDKIVSFCALHWMLDQENALLSIKNSLKAKGNALLVVPGRKPYNLGAAVEEVAHSLKWKEYFPSLKQQWVYFTPEEFSVLVEKAGLKIQSLKVSQTAAPFKDKGSLNAWIRPLFNFIDHLSDDLQDNFINDIIKYFLKFESFKEDGSIDLHYQKIEVIALK